jgi:hypothetical protein
VSNIPSHLYPGINLRLENTGFKNSATLEAKKNKDRKKKKKKKDLNQSSTQEPRNRPQNPNNSTAENSNDKQFYTSTLPKNMLFYSTV